MAHLTSQQGFHFSNDLPPIMTSLTTCVTSAQRYSDVWFSAPTRGATLPPLLDRGGTCLEPSSRVWRRGVRCVEDRCDDSVVDRMYVLDIEGVGNECEVWIH